MQIEMKTHISVTLGKEDGKLIERLKQNLIPAYGKISSAAVVRIALRKMANESNQSKNATS